MKRPSSVSGVGFLAFALAGVALSGCEVQDTSSLLFPHLRRSEIFGLVAGFGTTFAAFPDLLKMLRSRSSKGMNPMMAAIMGAFQVLWIYYGLLIGSRPVILWNILAVVVNCLTVGAYVRFSRREREQNRPEAGPALPR